MTFRNVLDQPLHHVSSFLSKKLPIWWIISFWNRSLLINEIIYMESVVFIEFYWILPSFGETSPSSGNAAKMAPLCWFEIVFGFFRRSKIVGGTSIWRFRKVRDTRNMVDTVPKDLRSLRACLVCSLIKVNRSFFSHGCTCGISFFSGRPFVFSSL